jgi:two-component system NtrC family sensor kinase
MSKRTREQELTAQLIQAEKMATLGFLVAGVAHEINTPMGAIHSNNDIMLRAVSKIRKNLEPDTNKEVVRLLEILEGVCRNNETAAERIMYIVRSLKNFARLDEADRKRVDLHEGVESTLMLLQHQLKSRIRIEKQFGEIPGVLCHPNQVNQVFMNILANAAQAIPGAGVIKIRTWRDGELVKVAITDTGVGIPRENLSKIFDAGFTTKAAGRGTGIGLSICYKIIEDHGGTIEVDSSNAGTTFTIALPVNGNERRERARQFE